MPRRGRAQGAKLSRGGRRESPARSPATNDTPTKRNSKVLKRNTEVSDDELSEGGIAEMVHESSGGRWTAFAEHAEQSQSVEKEDPVAENGDAGEDKNEGQEEDEDDDEDDEDMDEDL